MNRTLYLISIGGIILVSSVASATDSSLVQPISSSVPQSRQQIVWIPVKDDVSPSWNVSCVSPSAPRALTSGSIQTTYSAYFDFTYGYTVNDPMTYLVGKESSKPYSTYPSLNGVKCRQLQEQLNWQPSSY